MEQFGYVRVSSQDQNEHRQMIAMLEAGVPREHIFVEKQSGKDFDRPQYRRLVRQVLSFVAENERRNIRQRQAEGIAAAKSRGIRFGRLERPVPENFDQIHRQWREKKIPLRQAAAECGLPEGTFYGIARRREPGSNL